MNRIRIQGLEVDTLIGVPDDERATPQQLKVDITMTPSMDFAAMSDDVEKTIDYYAVSVAVAELAATGERKLIETLASEIADLLIEKFTAVEAKVQIRKYILPDTEWVAVECVKEA